MRRLRLAPVQHPMTRLRILFVKLCRPDDIMLIQSPYPVAFTLSALIAAKTWGRWFIVGAFDAEKNTGTRIGTGQETTGRYRAV